MKKIIVSILTVCLMGSLVGCGNANNSATTDTTAETTEAPTEAPEATEAPEETPAADPETDATEAEAPADDAAETTGATSLVVYFSATGNTANIGEIIAAETGADVFEIVPVEPYSDADLDYGDNSSRSTLEMDDPSSRPAIANTVENMDQYDTIYLGYPIWWGEAPRIVDTFVESYNFDGKTIYTFCTSASSGMGSSSTTLEALAGSGQWVVGPRFSGSEDASEVMEIMNSL